MSVEYRSIVRGISIDYRIKRCASGSFYKRLASCKCLVRKCYRPYYLITLTSIKTLLKNRLCILFYYFESLWKSLLNVVCQKWTIFLKWTNLWKTPFPDLIRYNFGFCLVGCLHLNKWLDAWENFWLVVGGLGFSTLFEELAGGAFDRLNYPGIWPKIF